MKVVFKTSLRWLGSRLARRHRGRARIAAASVLAVACGSQGPANGKPADLAETGSGSAASEPRQTANLTAAVGSTRFVTREHFLASGEMQISGEPFAEAMGRDLGNYSRDFVPPDIDFDKSPLASGPWIDLPGFSTAVESYEYSKQAMNNVAFESGAGTALAYGPLVNPSGLVGPDATALLAARVQHFASGSHALGRFVFPAGTYPINNQTGGNVNPVGAGVGSENPLGWPGIWPTAHAFRSFDPTVNPTSEIALQCSISSDDDPGASGGLGCADYECDATTLHLADRAAQVEPVITPGADGFSAWKYGLWTINYLQSMHDWSEAAVASVAGADLPTVGTPGNVVVGADDTGAATGAGTYLGSSDIEGFQAQMFIDEIDNRAEDWLMHLATSDGASLSGFASLADALAYDYSTPLRWFPGQVAVAESDDGSGFPHPAYALASADSDLLDQVGLLLGYSEFYALTDTSNADVGGSQPALAYFDGDPFAADNQVADGEPTLHDRALALLRVTLVNLDRLHVDPASGVLVDQVAMAGATPTRGSTVGTTSLAYAILGLRTALRSLSSQLKLYSNNTPDRAIGMTPLDAIAVHPPAGGTIATRASAILLAQAELLLAHLTDASGRAWDGWDLGKGALLDDQDTLDAHTAAIRGLFGAYLATGDVRFRDRARAVYGRLEAVFYDSGARIYTATPAPSTTVEYTPVRFALLQSALRDVYEMIAARPGGDALEPVLEERVARLNKLVLNGWDDRNENRIVDYPDECVNVQGAVPRGGLQMAERTLTGETGSLEEQLVYGQMRTVTSDREHDCVPEIDDAHLPAALADSVTFAVNRP
jgi:hypothetical protein